MQISFKRLDPNVPVPEYKTPGAVAFDLTITEAVTLQPGERKICPTGLVICTPPGYALILAPRSSNAKKGVKMANGIGVVDQDYCGPTDQLHLALYNFGQESYTVEKYERIAQGFFVPIVKAELVEVEELQAEDRGGFGSTG